MKQLEYSNSWAAPLETALGLVLSPRLQKQIIILVTYQCTKDTNSFLPALTIRKAQNLYVVSNMMTN